MGFLRPNYDEVNLKRSMALEYFNMHGIDSQFYAISVEQSNLYDDDNHIYEEPVNIPVIFQQFPDIRTLKKLGWFVGDTEDLPILMYIPFYDLEGNEIAVKDNVKISLPIEVPSLDTKTFKVKKIASKSFSALYWVVNIVPVPDTELKADEGDTDEDGFTFINPGVE